MQIGFFERKANSHRPNKNKKGEDASPQSGETADLTKSCPDFLNTLTPVMRVSLKSGSRQKVMNLYLRIARNRWGQRLVITSVQNPTPLGFIKIKLMRGGYSKRKTGFYHDGKNSKKK